MVDLQKILLSKVLKLGPVDISDEYEGSGMIRDRLRFKKVLLVLDDVNNLHQIKSLAGEDKWFGRGSRIIITTRDKHLLNKVDDIYEAHLLSNRDALQLFCRHAFEQNHLELCPWASLSSNRDKDYGDLSYRVVSYAHGLPLALKVLGSHLYGEGIDVWESALDRLKDAPEYTIFTSLEISFKGLSNIQQNIFLDIACFYRGWEVDDVKKRLHSRGFHPVEGITVLIRRSLIHILDGEIEMHDLIEEMGQHIVRQKANMEPGKYSRLWTFEDIYDVLTNNKGKAQVEALVLHDDKFVQGTHKGVFKKMNKLRLLDIEDDYLIPDYLPNTLQWLSWPYYPGKYLPEDFRPINLVHLDLSCSSIVETPDVSGMPNLEVLDLWNCENLLEVHPSIGVHKKLVRLCLKACYDLEKFVSLPESISRLSCLQVLDLSGCEMLEALPELPSSIKKLDLSGCTALTRVPSLVDLLSKYEHLNLLSLAGCNQLVKNHRSTTITCDLLAFWDWTKRSAWNVLCTREEMVQVYLPRIEVPDWFYRSTMPHVTITLPPSWFNDKLRRFALCANADYFNFKLHTCNGLVSLGGDYDILEEGTNFLYIPINTITRDREWKHQKDYFLFEVTNNHLTFTNYGQDTSWGISLVYEGEVDQDITHLTIKNHYDDDPRLKVCVAARNES